MGDTAEQATKDGVALPFNREVARSSGSNDDETGILAVVVDVQVTPGDEKAFIEASLKNCKASLLEPGIHRFDLLQSVEKPDHFLLVEMYNDDEAPARHKATAYYAARAEVANPMMARPRKASKFFTRHPSPLYFHKSSSHTHASKGPTDAWRASAGLGDQSSFSFVAPKLVLGRGTASKEITSSMKALNIKNPMLITGKSGMSRYSDIINTLGVDNLTYFTVDTEPTTEDATMATNLAKNANCDGVISIGGGCAIDLGKVVAALVTNLGQIVDGSPTTVFHYLEVVGKGQSIKVDPLQHIAVPTTAGTGAECTKNSVLKSVEHGRKSSIRHEKMLPSVAIVDPLLTMSCPPDVTAHVGLDALCQCIEPFVSIFANPVVDSVARDGMFRAARSLRAAVADGTTDVSAREDMALCSVLGGLSLANAKLGIVHGFAAVIGGMYENAPHGAICASLLPAAFRMNFEKTESLLAKETNVEKRAFLENQLERFQEVARICTGNSHATTEEGALWLEALVKDLKVPGICALVGEKSGRFEENTLKEIVEGTAESSSTKGNPIPLTQQEITDILLKSA